jgi:pimeloyl-ACP methyl ester carboxylesterase
MLEVRALWELGAFFSAYPLLRLSPRGDGHAVLVLPGMAASDSSTRPLRSFLDDLGYRSHGWGLGPNHGPRPGVMRQLHARLAELALRKGGKVSLIGWSLGGVLARELAREAPQHVRSVISLGSPFAGAPRASNAWKLYERLSGQPAGGGGEDRRRMRAPPPVPATAIFTRSDGIVAWQGCLEQPGPLSENIEVEGSHCGLGHNPLALHAIADRLSQPEGAWRPFERRGARAFAYRNPLRDLPADRTTAAG